MAVDMFLNGLATGESTKANASGMIEIFGYSWGVTNTGGVAHGTGTGAGKADAHQFTLTKSVDVATPVLYNLCTTGKHTATSNFIIRLSTGGTTTQTFMQYDMTEVFVESISWSGTEAASGKPGETVVLSAKSVSVMYTPQNADGSMGSSTIKGYDFAQNQTL